MRCGASLGNIPMYVKLIFAGYWGLLFDAMAGNKENLECVCAICHAGEPGHPTPGDMLVREFARWYVARYGPMALAHFNHYLAESGEDIVEPLEEIFAKDGGWRKTVIDAIIKRGRTGPFGEHAYDGLSGDVEILKDNMEVQDYIGAMGNIDHLFWELLTTTEARRRNVGQPGKALVHVRLRDKYEWHPADVRNSACIHLSMEHAKRSGAKDFWEVGEADVFLDLPAMFIPPVVPPTPTPPPPPTPTPKHKR